MNTNDWAVPARFGLQVLGVVVGVVLIIRGRHKPGMAVIGLTSLVTAGWYFMAH